jgi:hypothetical protein
LMNPHSASMRLIGAGERADEPHRARASTTKQTTARGPPGRVAEGETIPISSATSQAGDGSWWLPLDSPVLLWLGAGPLGDLPGITPRILRSSEPNTIRLALCPPRWTLTSRPLLEAYESSPLELQAHI